MPWIRIDDAILDNDKIAMAGPIGFALHMAAIVHCARNLTDGFVHFSRARTLLATRWTEGEGDDKHGPVIQSLAMTSGHSGMDGPEVIEHVIEVLCEIGLWEQLPHGYMVHDYLEYNPSKEEVLAEREQLRQQRSDAGRASAASRRRKFGSAQPERATERAVRTRPERAVEREPERSPNPVPVPEEQPPSLPTEALSPKPKRRGIATPIPDNFPDEALRDWATAEVPGIDALLQAAQFRDDALKQDKRWIDWTAAWRQWVRRSPQYSQPPARIAANGHTPANGTKLTSTQLAVRGGRALLGLNPESGIFGRDQG